jgi:hypothetical protein
VKIRSTPLFVSPDFVDATTDDFLGFRGQFPCTIARYIFLACSLLGLPTHNADYAAPTHSASALPVSDRLA